MIARIKLVPSPTTLNQAKSNVDLAQLRYQDALRELDRQRKVNKEGVDTEQAKVNFENASKQEKHIGCRGAMPLSILFYGGF